jgi:hypothetical protein
MLTASSSASRLVIRLWLAGASTLVLVFAPFPYGLVIRGALLLVSILEMFLAILLPWATRRSASKRVGDE